MGDTIVVYLADIGLHTRRECVKELAVVIAKTKVRLTCTFSGDSTVTAGSIRLRRCRPGTR